MAGQDVTPANLDFSKKQRKPSSGNSFYSLAGLYSNILSFINYEYLFIFS